MFFTILSFIFVLGVLVFIHEAGHFLTAKWIGVKVNVFSLGFPPKLIGRKWGDTEYRIGLLPLGGYVKMAGENPGEASGKPEEFNSRSKPERIAILFMGPFMNLVLAVLLLTALFMVGVEVSAGLDDPPLVRFVPADSPADRAGFEQGDRILTIDGEEIASWREALDVVTLNANQSLAVELVRGGERTRLTLDVEARGRDQIGYAGLGPTRIQVGGLSPGYPAEKAGLLPGDVILRLENEPIFTASQFIEALGDNRGEAVVLTVRREGQERQFSVTPVLDDSPGPTLTELTGGGRYMIGVSLSPETVLHRETNPAAAFAAGFRECRRIAGLTFVVISRMISGRSSIRQMSGPIGIARISGETARRGARSLIFLMALLSVNLGILNLLPIPVLDGGHIAVILVEGLARRDFSLEAKERILQVGLVFILLLMVTVFYVDLSKIESIGRFLPW